MERKENTNGTRPAAILNKRIVRRPCAAHFYLACPAGFSSQRRQDTGRGCLYRRLPAGRWGQGRPRSAGFQPAHRWASAYTHLQSQRPVRSVAVPAANRWADWKPALQKEPFPKHYYTSPQSRGPASTAAYTGSDGRADR